MNNDLLKAIGHRIKRLRDALGMLQKDFARSIGLSPSNLSHLESGRTKDPGILIFLKIAAQYRVSLEYLLMGNGNMFPNRENPGPARDRREVEEIDSVEDLLWLFERSRFFKDSIMGYAGKFKYENEVIIKKSIDKYYAKQKEKQDEKENKPGAGNKP
jgi:transcriptional regulator with XRE-family HTH domain